MECHRCPDPHSTDLYWIRGSADGQHDPVIVPECFEDYSVDPNIRLDRREEALHVRTDRSWRNECFDLST